MKFATYIALVGVSNQITINQVGTATYTGPATGPSTATYTGPATGPSTATYTGTATGP